ncbi:MAG: hypothetical protein JSS66_07750 [Armatimonadetes bacterium]|nr:hypothetical protein [Armatimonadota bacterium]
MRKMASAVRVIERHEATPPTAEDIKALRPYTNLNVGEQRTSDWYCLTRGLQGDLTEVLKCGYAYTDNHFVLDSLMCEWAYVINLDDEVLEVYQGFQEGKPGEGRYARIEPKWAPHHLEQPIEKRYFPVSLVAAFRFDALPSDKKFLRLILKGSEEEVEWLQEQFDKVAASKAPAIDRLLAIVGKAQAEELLGTLKEVFDAGYYLDRFNEDN